MQQFSKTEQKLIDQLELEKKDTLVINPYSRKSAMLCPEATALYDYIKGCEMSEKYKEMDKGLKIFSKYWPDEYMTLLN